MHSVPEPWNAFLKEVDQQLNERTQLICIGGFVVSMVYDLERQTSDIDFIDCVPHENASLLVEIAGLGTRIANEHKLYLQHTAVPTLPECYEDRLTELFEGSFENLSLWVPEIYDLMFSKLERNDGRDIEDIKRLSTDPHFDLEEFQRRYEQEFRVYVEDNRHRSTFKFWVDLITELKS